MLMIRIYSDKTSQAGNGGGRRKGCHMSGMPAIPGDFADLIRVRAAKEKETLRLPKANNPESQASTQWGIPVDIPVSALTGILGGIAR